MNEIKHNKEAIQIMLNGVNALANAVKITLGPKGRNVIIQKPYSKPYITKDGVSVAEAIELADPIENVIAQILKEVASKTADIAGDGTTTATVLAQAILQEGVKAINDGVSPTDIKKGLDNALVEVLTFLKENTTSIENNLERIQQVATISANNDSELGELIGSAIHGIGKNGKITSERSHNSDTYVDKVDGIEIDRGFMSPKYITNTEKMTAELTNTLVLIHDEKIETAQDILNILEHVINNGLSLLVIADEIDSTALSILCDNKAKAGLKICSIKAPGFGDKRKYLLEDIAILTGGMVISKENNLELKNATIDHLGKCEKVISNKDTTTFINASGSKRDVEARIAQIKKTMVNTKNPKELEFLEERVAKLSGGVAVLYVGATSELEMKEKKDRVDDALHATRAAVEEGIVPGGGVALLRASEKIKGNPHIGYQILSAALLSPFKQILYNAGHDSALQIHDLKDKSFNYGFNCLSEVVEDMVAVGIIDPVKVTRIALENAVSVSSTMLTTECIVINNLTTETKLF